MKLYDLLDHLRITDYKQEKDGRVCLLYEDEEMIIESNVPIDWGIKCFIYSNCDVIDWFVDIPNRYIKIIIDTD